MPATTRECRGSSGRRTGKCERQFQVGNTGVELIEGGQAGDDHAWWIVARPDTEEAVGLDVPARVDETGGGYNWTKVPDAKINPEDVAIWLIPYEDIREAVQDC